MTLQTCFHCDSSPCVCFALGIGLANYKAIEKRRKGRNVSRHCANISETYSAGLRTGEVKIGRAPVTQIDFAPARKRKAR